MKSIIQEARTISQAIEYGWENAGKPAEFNVKIFEEPQKNFLGFTVKPAKVGIFFYEKPSLKNSSPKDQKEFKYTNSHNQQQHPRFKKAKQYQNNSTQNNQKNNLPMAQEQKQNSYKQRPLNIKGQYKHQETEEFLVQNNNDDFKNKK